MGTAADFYVGKGKDAEWVGSISSDGQFNSILRRSVGKQIMQCLSPQAFKHAVRDFIIDQGGWIPPEHKWPWKWKNSGTTGPSYWFFDGKVWTAKVVWIPKMWAADMPHYYVPIDELANEPHEDKEEHDRWISHGRERIEFPTMGPDLRFDLIGRN